MKLRFTSLVAIGIAMGAAPFAVMAQPAVQSVLPWAHVQGASESHERRSFIDDLPRFDRRDIHDAAASMKVHGLDARSYLERLESIKDDESAALQRFVADMAADLRLGATRDKASVSAEAMQAIVTQLQDCAALAQCLQQLAAQHPQYEKLQLLLDDYQVIALNGGWPKIEGGPMLRPDMRDARLAQVRQLLLRTGDLIDTHQDEQHGENYYSPALEEAVRRFQQRHGLKVDGVIGPDTLAQMNVPAEKRVTQIKLTLERLRKATFPSDERYVQVNIPSYELKAYEQGEERFSMPVIVGTSRNPTPEFSNRITTVGINPTWTPPKSILRKSLLPKIRRDAGELSRGNFSVRDRQTGEALSPESVDWQSVSASDIVLVQRSGRGNALGKVKFMLPDNQAIYLHDTSSPRLFNKAKRAFSHGCIRLAEPERFLEYVMRPQPDIAYDRVQQLYHSSERKHLNLSQPLKVQTTYYTAWVTDDGHASFYEDIYRKDDRLALALERKLKQLASR